MTSAELQAIRARLEKASDGPWTVKRIPNSYESAAGDRFTHPCVRGFRAPRRLYNLAWEQCEADAEFMASARQDVPGLLTEVEQLRGALQECRAAIHDLMRLRAPVSPDDLSAIEQFLAEEEAQWEGVQKKSAQARRLYVTQVPMRPKELKVG